MKLWSIEHRIWKKCRLPLFEESLANDITITRGRLAYLGIGGCNVAYAIVNLTIPESGLLAIIFALALMFFAANVSLDAVDGYVARQTRETETGRFLDLASDGANVFFSSIILLEVCGWPLFELVVPAVGITACGVVTFAHRISGTKNYTTISARFSQGAIYLGIGLFVAMLIGRFESALAFGALMLWTGFALKILSTVLYTKKVLGKLFWDSHEAFRTVEVTSLWRGISRLL